MIKHIFLLLPFGYFYSTRLSRVIDIVYLISTSWIPGVWIIWRLGADLSILDSAILFLGAYYAFIAIYEIGYFTNDYWDAYRNKLGRKRSTVSMNFCLGISFVAIRLAFFIGISAVLQIIDNITWLAVNGAIVIVFSFHNFISANAYRPATFLQLAVLRFSAPVLPWVADKSAQVLICATLIYAYLRFLSYLDSKNLLAMPARAKSIFPATQLLLIAPFILAFSLIDETSLWIEWWCFAAGTHLCFAALYKEKRVKL